MNAARVALVGLGVLLLIAFRSLLASAFAIDTGSELEIWLFEPTSDARAIAMLAIPWLLWRQRHPLGREPARTPKPRDVLAAAVILGVFGWAVAWQAPLLMVVALALTAGLLAAAWGGLPALRAVAPSVVVLAASTPPPNPLFSELVWSLQKVAARGAHALLNATGFPLVLEGVELRSGDYAFAVIESCSGWQGITILVIVAVLASELNRLSFRQTLLAALFAVPVGIALNVVRVAIVVAVHLSTQSEGAESHTPQGIAVLLAGTVVLYAFTALLAGGRATASAASPEPTSPADAPARTPESAERRRRAYLFFALPFGASLAVLSFALPRLSVFAADPTSTGSGATAIELPLEKRSWRGEPNAPDYFFPYNVGDHPRFHVLYRSDDPLVGAEVVDLFIAQEAPLASGLNRLPWSKLLVPAMDWRIESRDVQRLAILGVDAHRAFAVRQDSAQRAYVLAWRANDRGLFEETFWSAVGMDACEVFRRKCDRRVIRLAVPISTAAEDPEAAESRAKATATRFMRTFQESLMRVSERTHERDRFELDSTR